VEADRGVGLVAAQPQGWWYSTPLPGGRRLLTLQTDADLPAARLARSKDALLAAARETLAVATLLGKTGFRPTSNAHLTAVHGCRLEPAAGKGGWPWATRA
jgi:hypothetical protein